MPTIKTSTQKKTKESYERNQTEMRVLRQKAYNNTNWKKVRDAYMKQNPLCEECLKQGKVTPATSVHHLKSPFSKGEINYTLLLEYENLMAICHECHGKLHAQEQGHKPVSDIISELDRLLNDNT